MLDVLLRIVFALMLAAGNGGAGLAALTRDAPTTPASTPTAPDVDGYTAAVGPGLAQLGDGVGAMIDTMGAPAIANEEWRARAAAGFGAIRAGHAALVAVQPEPALTEVHATLTAATQHCADGADAAQLAIDEGNVLALYAAAQLVQTCADGIAEWTGMLDAMGE